MLPVRYTFMPLRAPSLSKLEGHVPLSGIWIRRLCLHYALVVITLLVISVITLSVLDTCYIIGD